MPITLAPNKLFAKKEDGSGYLPANVVTGQTTEEQCDRIQSKADEVTAQLANAAEVENMFAGAFNTTTNYVTGQYVIQTITSGSSSVNKLFRFTADHAAGAWTGTDAVEVKICNDVSDLKSAFDVTNNPVSWQPILKKGEFIRGVDGIAVSNSKYARTNALWIGYGSRIAVVLSNTDYEFYISYYNSTGALDGTGYIGYSDWYKGTGYIPARAEMFGVTFRRTDQAGMTDSDITAILAASSAYAPTDTTLTVNGIAADAKTVGDIFNSIVVENTFPQPYFVNGGISNTNGKNTDATNRVRSSLSEIYTFNDDGLINDIPVEITISEGYKLGLREYEWYPASFSNNGFTASYGFYTGVVTLKLKAGYWYRFLVGRTDDADLSSADANQSEIFSLKYYATTDKTLKQCGKAADAKITGDYIHKINTALFAKSISSNETATLEWEQGEFTASGSTPGGEVDSTTRIRSQSIKSVDLNTQIKVSCPNGNYKFGYWKYNNGAFEERVKTQFDEFLLNYDSPTVYYRLLVGKADGSTITPDDSLDGLIIEGVSNGSGGGSLSDDSLITLAKNGDAAKLPFGWVQGGISSATGANYNDSPYYSNRIRTPYVFATDSLQYLYIHCPPDYKFAIFKYEPISTNDYHSWSGFLRGDVVYQDSAEYNYRFVIGKDDDTDLSPSEIPEGFEIIPVYYPVWAEKATGKSIGPFITARSNPTYVAQMLAVAQTYYDHRNDKTNNVADMVYSTSSILDTDEYTNGIDCSTFTSMVLRGIPYTETELYTHTARAAASYKANPNYVWSINSCEYYNRRNKTNTYSSPVRAAAQLAQWFVDQRRQVVKDDRLINLNEGDICFWSKENSGGGPIRPHRFMIVSHVGICYSKKAVTEYDPNSPYDAGDLVVYDDALYESKNNIETPEQWTSSHWTQLYSAWDIEKYPYCHRVIEVTGSEGYSPAVRKDHIVERDWDVDDYTTRNNIHTLTLIGRPDLGSI